MKNILQFSYEKIWVPVFGRLLMVLSSLIEGKSLKDAKQTYDLSNQKAGKDK